MALTFRVELVWKGEGEEGDAPSIFLTGDGRVVLQGRRLSEEERRDLKLPLDGEMISVDRATIKAIKEML